MPVELEALAPLAPESSPPRFPGATENRDSTTKTARILSVCPLKRSDGAYVIGLETADEFIDYTLDEKDALFLATALGNYYKLFHLSGSAGTPSEDALKPSS